MQLLNAEIGLERVIPWDQMPVVLSVDDDHRLLFLYWQSFGMQGLRCLPCATGEAAMEALLTVPVSLVTMDYDMPGRNGVELAREIRKLRPGVPIMLVSGTTFAACEAECFDGVYLKGGPLRNLFAAMHELLAPGSSRQKGMAA
jgi:CheY-like chemotaxis protein